MAVKKTTEEPEPQAGAVDVQKLTAPFPSSAIKSRVIGGGRKADYVEGHTVIHRLNDATGNRWDFSVDRLEMNEGLLMASVTLTIPGLGSRQHIGVQRVEARGGEDLAKGAVTDALKKAATLFGVGLELYGPDYEAGELPQYAAPGPPNKIGPRTEPPDDLDRPAPPITDKTLKHIYAVGRQKGWDHEKLKAQVKKHKGLDHLKDLSESAGVAFIGWLNQLPDVAEKDQPTPSLTELDLEPTTNGATRRNAQTAH